MNTMLRFALLSFIGLCHFAPSSSFTAYPAFQSRVSASPLAAPRAQLATPQTTKTSLNADVQSLDVIALVAGQENYGFAIVCLGEAVWSFLQAPSLDHAKVFIPAGVAAVVLVAVSGPMLTSGDAGSVATGLYIATAVSVALGASYAVRMLNFSPSPKEIAFCGLLVALAGFFSFSQNLVVDGFVTLPSIPLPSLPNPNFYGRVDF
jgi:hypothetical protein